MIDPSELIATAYKILQGSPTDSDLRRAVATAYYAMFHHICASFSTIVKHPAGEDYARARLQAYRYIDHGFAKTRCIEAKSSARKVPPGMVRFATAFVDLQQYRSEADYDPDVIFDEASVRNYVGEAQNAMLAYDSESMEAQRAFAIFIALRSKTR